MHNERKLSKKEIEELIKDPGKAEPGLASRIEVPNTEMTDPGLLLLRASLGGRYLPITEKQTFNVDGLCGMTEIDNIPLGLAARVAQRVGKFRIEIYVKKNQTMSNSTIEE